MHIYRVSFAEIFYDKHVAYFKESSLDEAKETVSQWVQEYVDENKEGLEHNKIAMQQINAYLKCVQCAYRIPNLTATVKYEPYTASYEETFSVCASKIYVH